MGILREVIRNGVGGRQRAARAKKRIGEDISSSERLTDTHVANLVSHLGLQLISKAFNQLPQRVRFQGLVDGGTTKS